MYVCLSVYIFPNNAQTREQTSSMRFQAENHMDSIPR